MFSLCYFLLCSKLSYVYNPSLLYSLSLYGNTKSPCLGVCFLFCFNFIYFFLISSTSPSGHLTLLSTYQTELSNSIFLSWNMWCFLWRSKRRGAGITIHFLSSWPFEFWISTFPLILYSSLFTDFCKHCAVNYFMVSRQEEDLPR